MRHPSRGTLRWLMFMALILNVITALFVYGVISSLESPDMKTLREWSWWESLADADTVFRVWVVWSGAHFVGMLAFLCFRPWSRWLLLGLEIVHPVLTLFSGVYVASAAEIFMGSVFVLFYWFPLVLSFFPPCSEYFFRTPTPAPVPRGGDK